MFLPTYLWHLKQFFLVPINPAASNNEVNEKYPCNSVITNLCFCKVLLCYNEV